MQYEIEGKNKLEGRVKVQGSKNSALPILAATILNKGQTILHNCPKLTDIDAAVGILRNLGCNIVVEEDVIIIDADVVCKKEIPESLMREMRSSIIFLGAILARCQRCRLSYPGGCELGSRPIDLHIDGLRKMGVTIDEDRGFLDCYAKNGLKGADITLSFPSVGATENIMIAATVASGRTRINNAAREPEIVDLANFLISCGAKIAFDSYGNITIDGVKQLNNTEYSIMADRIVALTYLAAGAITSGDILVEGINAQYIDMVLPIFEEAGCLLKKDKDKIHIKGVELLNNIKPVRTMPYPGFPTDAQALIMAMMTRSQGSSVFVENIFENRYKHANELKRMGAKISVEGRVAIVDGVDDLYGTTVESTDLRGGAGLVIAGLGAVGKTHVGCIKHIDRGYENFEENLRNFGAKIERKFK